METERDIIFWSKKEVTEVPQHKGLAVTKDISFLHCNIFVCYSHEIDKTIIKLLRQYDMFTVSKEWSQ
jgi:hypothetical protein